MGVHIAFFADAAKLTSDEIRSLTHGTPSDACWTDHRERSILAAVDELHANAHLSDATYADAAGHLTEAELLDLTVLTGWYHAISFAANAFEVPLEEGAPSFGDV